MRNICWSSKQLFPQVSRLREDAGEGGAPPTPAASVLHSRDSPRKVPSQRDDSRLLPNRKRSRNSKPTLGPGLQEAKPVTAGGRLVSLWRRQEVGDWEKRLVHRPKTYSDIQEMGVTLRWFKSWTFGSQSQKFPEGGLPRPGYLCSVTRDNFQNPRGRGSKTSGWLPL